MTSGTPPRDPPASESDTPRIEERYFAFSLVDAIEEKRKTFRIRYQVYCLERGLLPADAYPGKEESDAYDEDAVHVLASHVNGHEAGCARLVIGGPLGLPLVKFCALDAVYGFLAEPDHPKRAQYAEISRLSVSKEFRRRRGDSFYGGAPRQNGLQPSSGVIPLYPLNDIPEIVSGIYRLLYQESKRRGITHWVVAMERGLSVMLKRMGFQFKPAGPEADYYGPVRPCIAEIAQIERDVYSTRPETLRYMLTGLEPELIPAFARGLLWERMASTA